MPDDNKIENEIEVAKVQLERVLGFFASVDSKASVALGVNVAMLGLLAANAPSAKLLNPWDLFSIPPVGLIGISLFNLYQCSFPRLEGGKASLVYFREIADRTEAKYIEEFRAESGDQHLKDLLGQVWQNSKILRQRYELLRKSLIFLAWGTVTWTICLAIFAAQNKAATSLLTVK
jgi:hypothetical protein